MRSSHCWDGLVLCVLFAAVPHALPLVQRLIRSVNTTSWPGPEWKSIDVTNVRGVSSGGTQSANFIKPSMALLLVDILWNYLLLMLSLGLLKAALSFCWPSIGEWRYDDLHASLRYHESCRAKQLVVNTFFFVVYPFVLCARWYKANHWTFGQTASEKDVLEQYVEFSQEERQLLRDGMLRGRMIIQTEIVLTGPADDDPPSYRRYDGVDDGCAIGVDAKPVSNEEACATKCKPLILAKDGDVLHGVVPNSPDVSSEEEATDDTIRLIQPTQRTLDDVPSSNFRTNSKQLSAD